MGSRNMKSKIIIMIVAMVLGIIINAHAANEVTNIMNLPTCQTTGSKIVLFDVGHRYLDVNRHTTNINITFGYGFTDWMDAYAGYSFKNKDIIASGKVTILNDFSSGGLLSFAIVAGAGYKDTNQINNSVSTSYADKDHSKSTTVLDSKERASYFAQVVIQKHLFANRFSIGVVPMYAYNTNFYGVKSKDDYSAGAGFSTEIYIFEKVALCGETVINMSGFAFKYANYNAGIKYAGYRHTFTIWIGNSPGYSPVEYIVGSPVNTPKISFDFTREFDI
jgi:hypothetical protein